MKSTTWTVETPARLDATVKILSGLSNSRARRAVQTGKVTVGGKRVTDPAHAVAPGATVGLDMAAPDPARTEPLGLRLIFRDEHLLVVDKLPGMVTAPTPLDTSGTALHAATVLCRGSGGRPKVVHRLDKDTSGLLIFARSVPVARAFREAFDAHAVQRTYHCVVQGVPANAAGLISSMLVRDAGEGRRGSRHGTFRLRDRRSPSPGPMPGAGKLAVTRYDIVAQNGEHAALEVQLETGHTHQIRIHLAELGHPILGEHVYARIGGAPRQALHSARLTFRHPVTEVVHHFDSPWPPDLANVTPRGRDW